MTLFSSSGYSPSLPSLCPIQEASVITLPKPLPITNNSKSKNPWDKDAIFTNALLVSPQSSTSQLLIIRDIDLKLQRSAKRTKGNDGAAINYEKNDYRVVLVQEGKQPKYYAMLRLAIEEAIKKMDQDVGVDSREKSCSRIHYRLVPGQDSERNENEDSDEDEDEDGDGGEDDVGNGNVAEDDDNDSDSEDKGAGENNDAGPASKPACW